MEEAEDSDLQERACGAIMSSMCTIPVWLMAIPCAGFPDEALAATLSVGKCDCGFDTAEVRSIETCMHQLWELLLLFLHDTASHEAADPMPKPFHFFLRPLSPYTSKFCWQANLSLFHPPWSPLPMAQLRLRSLLL